MAEDLTEEILRDLPPSVRSTVEQAIARRRAEAAIGSEARDMIREIRDGVAAINERVVRMEEAQAQQRAFYWPGLERRIEAAEQHAVAVARQAETRADEIEEKLDQIGIDLRNELRALREARGALYDAAAAACRVGTELTRLLLDRPAVLVILVIFVLTAVGLGLVASGGQLASAWGDWSLRVDTRENREAGPDDLHEGTGTHGTVPAPAP